MAQAGAAPSGQADHDRFVGLAFAGAHLLLETDAAGRVTYAAGAFRSAFGRTSESFLGRSFTELLAPADRAAAETCFSQLHARGRLVPVAMRLHDAAESPVALAGLAVPGARGRATRYFLTLATAPVPAPVGSGLGQVLAAAIARLRAGEGGPLGLVEIGGAPPARLADALRDAAGDALTGEISPGRFGILGGSGEAGAAAIAARVDAALRRQGIAAEISAQDMTLAQDGLTPAQAVHALRHALDTFARAGRAGLDRAGFAEGLAGYVGRAQASAGLLRRALRDGAFELSYQPIASLADRAVHHHEALLRPAALGIEGVATPQDFVCLTESLGMAGELDMTVTRLACEAAQRSRRAIAFNISAASAADPAFRERFIPALQQAGAVAAGLVTVELTETAIIDDLAEVARTAQALRGLGVVFCLDDFGAGSSDIRVLRALEPDFVKLDGSYMRDAEAEARTRALLTGMVELAHAAGARVIAEHIETEAQAEHARALGVAFGQGFLFDRPGPLPEAAASVVSRRRGARDSWG